MTTGLCEIDDMSQKLSTWAFVKGFDERLEQLRCPTCNCWRARTPSGWCCLQPHSRLLLYELRDESIIWLSQFPVAVKKQGSIYTIDKQLYRREAYPVERTSIPKRRSNVNASTLDLVPHGLTVARVDVNHKWRCYAMRAIPDPPRTAKRTGKKRSKR